MSEVVVPVRDRSGAIVAVLDVDSAAHDAFSKVDAAGLERIAALIYG
jgi:L-methionine (R)-S-oxide reductase